MFVNVRNNLKDSTAVVAYAHIPPGETREVRKRDYDKWKDAGGHRLLDAGTVEEVKTTAAAPPADEPPAAPPPADEPPGDEGGLSDSPPSLPADDEPSNEAGEEAPEEATEEEADPGEEGGDQEADEEPAPAPAPEEPTKKRGRGR